MPKHRLYIDESGNSDLKNSDDQNHRFLSLTGVIVSLAYVAEKMHPEMEDLKWRHFGLHPDEPVSLHRSDLVNRRPPFQALRDSRVKCRFDQDLLAYIRDWEYRVITVCLDKKAHVEKYGDWARDPYYYCLEVLMERFTFWLSDRKSNGDVMIEARGNKEDKRLKNQFRFLWEQGTDHIDPNQIQRSLTSRELKVNLKSENITGLQLADLLAQPSRSEILYEQGLLERELAPFTQQIVEILADKYRRRGNRIYGYGKKFI